MDTKSSGNGIGLLGAVFIVFLVLKLCRVTDWSWWWITAPLWIPAGIVVTVLLVIGITCLVAYIKAEGK
jgi:hypothetical protein